TEPIRAAAAQQPPRNVVTSPRRRRSSARRICNGFMVSVPDKPAGNAASALRSVEIRSALEPPSGGFPRSGLRPALQGGSGGTASFSWSPLRGAQAPLVAPAAPALKGGPIPLRGKPPEGGWRGGKLPCTDGGPRLTITGVCASAKPIPPRAAPAPAG